MSLELLVCRFTKRLIFEFVNTVFMGFYRDDEQEEKRERPIMMYYRYLQEYLQTWLKSGKTTFRASRQ